MIVRVQYTERNWGGWEAVKDGDRRGVEVYFGLRDAQREARKICRAAGGGEVRLMGMGGSVISVEEVEADA